MTAQVPPRKSLRLAEVDIDLSWNAVAARAHAEAEKEKEVQQKEMKLKRKELKKRKLEKMKLEKMEKNRKRSSPDQLEDNKRKLKDEKPNVEEISEYEKMVQKNRDEKTAFLQALRIDELKENLNEGIKNLKPEKLPSKSRTKSPKSVMSDQDRKSLRLAKMDNIDFSWEAIEVRALTKAEKEFKKVQLPPILTFEKAITRDILYTDFVHDFDDLHFGTPKPFTDYVSCFKNMTIDESKIAKVVNARIAAMALHPMKEKLIVSAANNSGAIGLWNMDSGSVPYEFKPHIMKVPCLKFNSDFPNQIYSCSYDGTMRCGDMEKKVFNEVFTASKNNACNYFDFTSPTTTIVCHRYGKISLVDIRSDSKSAEKSLKSTEYSLKTVSVHPVKKSYFVTADNMGFLSLWDLRRLGKIPVIEVHPHRKVIYSAFFSPVTGNSILTASEDDSLCVFDCSKLVHDLLLDSKKRHNNGPQGESNKTNWLPNTDDAFVIGSMDYPRRIEVFNDNMDNIYNFEDEHLKFVTSINVFHPSLPVLAGGGTNGEVYIFS